jgi:hypothetical protein
VANDNSGFSLRSHLQEMTSLLYTDAHQEGRQLAENGMVALGRGVSMPNLSLLDRAGVENSESII